MEPTRRSQTLSVNSQVAGSQPGANQSQMDAVHARIPVRCIQLTTIDVEPDPSGDGLARFLLESLILAQDERWRRA